MSEEAAVLEFSAETKKMGDQIAEMTLKQAKELSDYLKEVHGIEPAAGGGAVMMAAPAEGGAAAAVEQTEFDVVLTGFGDKKLNVVKVVKNLTDVLARTSMRSVLERFGLLMVLSGLILNGLIVIVRMMS